MKRLRPLRPVIALFWAGDRRTLAAGAVLSLATALAGIALLGLSGWFIAATAIAGTTVATALAFDVFMPSAGIRLLALGRTASRYGERLATHDATLRMLARLRERLFRGWAGAGAARTLADSPSRRLFRLTLDIDALDSLYLRVAVPALAAAGAALAVAAALAFIDPLLGLVTGAALLAGGLGLPLLAAGKAAAASRRRAHGLEAIRARAIDLVRGHADLAVAGRLGAQTQALGRADAYLTQADRALNRVETATGFRLAVLGAALLSATILAVAHLAEAGTIGTPGAAFAVLLAVAALEPFGLLRRGAVEFGRTLLAARRLGPSLRRQAREAQPTRLPADALAARLEAAGIRHAGARLPVLSGLSLDIGPGERVALVGASGAGKSTLLDLLAGEIPAASGQVATAGTCLMTQRTELFRDTLRGNLALARADATDAQMRDALEAAGLAPLVASLPRGLDTPLGEGGAGLSAGQARRLALARLVLRDAPVWLLDEPTEGLDVGTARDVLQRLADAAAGRTLVIATHARREAALAGRILVLEDGRIAADLRNADADFAARMESLRRD